MAIQSQPSRIPQPFAGSGTKNTIPATNTTPSASQAASWASGFPPECSQPISAGGCPVPRNDMNGALNWLSQDFAFRQDGGIWAWSALADYDIGRFVRGSDSSFYKAAAQSGPATVAGAKDPTADDGTYWIKMPSMADMSAWVHGEVDPATIYVDYVSGDDANDGLSSSRRVKTIAHALDLAAKRFGGLHTISLGNGDVYVEDVSIKNIGVKFIIEGNVTIGGTLSAENSLIYFDGPDKTLIMQTDHATASQCIIESSNSLISFGCVFKMNITGGTVYSAIQARYFSHIIFQKNFTSSTSVPVTMMFLVFANSMMRMLGSTVTVNNGSNISIFAEFLNVGWGSFESCVFNSNTSSSFVISSLHSFVRFVGCNFNDVSAYNTLDCTVGSVLAISSSCYGFLKATAGGICLTSNNGSAVTMSSSAMSFVAANSSTIAAFIDVINNSSFIASDGSTLNFQGDISKATIQVLYDSSLYVTTDVTVVGAVTGGKPPYSASGCSTIWTNRAALFPPTNGTGVLYHNAVYI